MTTWTNWAGTVTAHPAAVIAPDTVDELQQAVVAAAAHGTRIKPIGAGHSFTAIGQTDGAQLRLDRLAGILRADRETGLVTVLAGTRLHDLNEALWHLGLAMSNLGDIDVQTISGAISTGTHGTGATFGGLATQVQALQLVLADGSLLTCDANNHADVFAAARVGLGAIGVIATVTLQCEPAYALAAAEAPAQLDDVLADLDANVDGNDHYKFFWFPHTRRALTKRNNRVLPGTELRPLGRLRRYVDDELLANTVFDAVNRLTTRRPALIARVNSLATRALSARDYIDRSDRVFASSRRVRFREMEYAVPRAAVPDVLVQIQAYLARSGEQVAFPVEVRFAAADDIWLSTAYGRQTGYVAVHQYVRREHGSYFRAVEQIATAVGGRPHWGKLHAREAASLREDYPHFDDFVAVRDKLDPQRVFGNEYLTRVLGS
ncbi:MAG: FAD-linked oxidoreductase [Pseudonocardiales bacterium]|nr:MAG: FAD-linked oxidoreductase [Pseudonocardiales bacterium]